MLSVLSLSPVQMCPRPPSVANGHYRIRNPFSYFNDISRLTYRENTRLVYFCDNGYSLKTGTSETRYCQRGDWTGPEPTCVPTGATSACSPPYNIDNAFLFMDLQQGNNRQLQGMMQVPEGTKAIYTCNNGYRMTGDAEHVCRRGHWQGKLPECVPKTCSNPPEITSGGHQSVYGSSDDKNNEYRDGTILHYFCHNGYRFEDRNISALTCVSGSWAGYLSKCGMSQSAGVAL